MKHLHSTSCIIPFYNEGKRIFPILNVVTQIAGITQIICVDDGSSDFTATIIEKKLAGNNIAEAAGIPRKSICNKAWALYGNKCSNIVNGCRPPEY